MRPPPPSGRPSSLFGHGCCCYRGRRPPLVLLPSGVVGGQALRSVRSRFIGILVVRKRISLYISLGFCTMVKSFGYVDVQHAYGYLDLLVPFTFQLFIETPSYKKSAHNHHPSYLSFALRKILFGKFQVDGPG